MEKRNKTGENAALELTPDLVRQFLAASIAGVGITDHRGVLVHVNNALLEMWGYTDPSEMVGRRVTEFLEESTVHETIETLARRGSCTRTAMGRRKDDSGFEVLFGATLIRDESGRPAYVFASFVDISGEEELKRRLHESEAKYRTLLENVPCMVYLGRADWSTEVISGYSELITGYAVSDFNEGRINWKDLIHPDDREQVFAETGWTGDRARRLDQEYRIVKRDGTVAWVKDVKTLRFQNGAPTGAQGVVIDITERKAMQERLVQSDRLASLGLLVAGVAHEMNNPLSVLLGYIGLLSEKVSLLAPESQSQMPGIDKALRNIERAAGRCRKVVDDLRTFAEPDDQLTQRTSLEDVVRTAVQVVSAKAEKLEISIHTNVEEPVHVLSNPRLLTILFTNLLTNAVQSIEDGGRIDIGIRAVEESQCEVSVRDSGRGIPKELLNRVFDPFFSTKPFGEGSGIGLSISYGIVASHRGRIELDSTPGKGTTVRVLLPTAPREDTRDSASHTGDNRQR